MRRPPLDDVGTTWARPGMAAHNRSSTASSSQPGTPRR